MTAGTLGITSPARSACGNVMVVPPAALCRVCNSATRVYGEHELFMRFQAKADEMIRVARTAQEQIRSRAGTAHSL